MNHSRLYLYSVFFHFMDSKLMISRNAAIIKSVPAAKYSGNSAESQISLKSIICRKNHVSDNLPITAVILTEQFRI
jgi:hypothetical protein